MRLLEVYLVKLGVVYAEQVLMVADGAPWIWQRLPALLERLGVPASKRIELIDFYHAAEHLRRFAEAAFSRLQEARDWFTRTRSRLKHKPFAGLLRDLKILLKGVKSQNRAQALAKQLLYFSEQPQRFDYARVQAMKLPIGSGAIESLIRQVVNLRLKSTGKFWLPEHAEIVLHGRCQWAAGQWDSFCQRVLTAGLDPKNTEIVELRPDLSPAAA
jgi:hypothetical protein